MNFWKMSKLRATRAFVTTIGVSMIAPLATVMYWQTTQAAPIDGGNGQAQGVISVKPDNGFIGEWVIDTNTVVVDQATEIKQAALLNVGGCARLTYQLQGTTKQALVIEGQPAGDCGLHGTATPTVTVTPDDHGGDDHHGGGDDDKDMRNTPHGRINSFPAGLLGNWVISGTTYVVTKTTQLEQRYGAFAVGACVQVKSDKSTTPPTALRIRTKQDFVCTSDDDHGNDGHDGHPGFPPGLAHGTLFGVIQTFPTTTLTGTWKIGGMSLVADNKTKFNQEHGAFAISVTVQVDFLYRYQ